MASIFSHGIAAFAIGKITILSKQPWKLWILGIVCSMIPDADTLAFRFGIPYESMWGHRGITHSIFFAVLLALLVMLIFYKNAWKSVKEGIMLFLYFFLATVSHPVLDAMTNGGLGVAFFAPFNNHRYFFPWRPIQVSPIGAKAFFSAAGWRVIKSELIWVWMPSLTLIATGYLIRKRRTKN
ncbi:MAG: metal-dependent hydrolase [Cytophagaceae bacterium]